MSYDQKKPGQGYDKNTNTPNLGQGQKKPQGQGGYDQKQPTGGTTGSNRGGDQYRGGASQKPSNPSHGSNDYNKDRK